MRRILLCAGFALAICIVRPSYAAAQSDAAAAPPADYATFTKGLTPQRGLFTLWRKNAKVYIELTKDQLDADFIQTAVPANGVGGLVVTPGLPYVEFPTARIVRFTRANDKIVVTWPNTSFIAANGTAGARAVAASFAPSVIATAAVVAQDAASGRLVFDGSYLLGDVLDLTDQFRQALNTDAKPGSAYRLDDTRTYFGPTKAFPENVIVEADQTFTSAMPPDVLDNVIDARAIQIDVKYNIAKAPAPGSYMPRLADDRVGYYPNIQLQFDSDNVRERQVRTIVRWNVARHPMVYYISNTVPVQYRQTIRDALLTWNRAFAAVGYPNAVVVKDQPDDPEWDPDDIRYKRYMANQCIRRRLRPSRLGLGSAHRRDDPHLDRGRRGSHAFRLSRRRRLHTAGARARRCRRNAGAKRPTLRALKPPRCSGYPRCGPWTKSRPGNCPQTMRKIS